VTRRKRNVEPSFVVPLSLSLSLSLIFLRAII
jgi:hypothetical protein